MINNPIDRELDRSLAEKNGVAPEGPIASVARRYRADDSDRLLGFLLSLDYNELRIVTCDPWKRKCGGVPRNSFVIVKLGARAVDEEDRIFCDRIILARVTDSVPTPVQTDVEGAVFQLHKVQAIPDPVTNKELQWSALKATVVGTYYDARDEDSGEMEAAFGNDVDTFFSPHAYEVYVPDADDLSLLINSFVGETNPLEIGALRYTETPRPVMEEGSVPVMVDPADFVGREYGNRTALFGKTRMGKSNTVKVIADTILSSERSVGQIIFDPSGEYTYVNQQDNTSLYSMHPDKCIRYSLSPRSIPSEEAKGFAKPKSLRVNFYRSAPVGHALIQQLWDSIHQAKPNYMLPILNWTPPDVLKEPDQKDDQSAHAHFWRSMSLWFALLRLAEFTPKNDEAPVYLEFQKNVKAHLVSELGETIRLYEDGGEKKFANKQPLRLLPTIYRMVAELWDEHKGKKDWFKTTDGSSYFNSAEQAMLRILKDDGSISGKQYFEPFKDYHDPKGSSTFDEISRHARDGKTVLVDFARADEGVRRNLSERICGRLLGDMMKLFSDGELDDRFVVLYFEEAHELFPQADKDLNNVYNKLAKEGAKFHISMVYATQSMTTLSPDLLKNTENFFIAHLDDDREVREVTRKYIFRDVADDVQRTMSKGFVRMITQSHRFALPVQIRKFEPRGMVDGSALSNGVAG